MTGKKSRWSRGWGRSLGHYKGVFLPRDQSSSLILSSADSGGAEVQKNYELFCKQNKSYGKVLRQSAFLGDPPNFSPHWDAKLPSGHLFFFSIVGKQGQS